MKISSHEAARHAAEVLRERMVNTENSAVVLTLGEQGTLMLTETISELIPALSVEPIDTTGAGDAFCGALATALASGREPTLSSRVRKRCWCSGSHCYRCYTVHADTHKD